MHLQGKYDVRFMTFLRLNFFYRIASRNIPETSTLNFFHYHFSFGCWHLRWLHSTRPGRHRRRKDGRLPLREQLLNPDIRIPGSGFLRKKTSNYFNFFKILYLFMASIPPKSVLLKRRWFQVKFFRTFPNFSFFL